MSHEITADSIFANNQVIDGSNVSRIPTISRLTIIFLIIFGSVIAADRFLVPPIPINVDPGSYAVVSHEILQGRSLYTDIWDHKPPAVFVVYALAEMAFGYSTQTLVILDIIISILVLLGVFYAARSGPGGDTAGLWAAAIWAAVAGSFQLEARDPNTEVLINVCTVFAFGIIAANFKNGLGTRRALFVGSLFLLGSLLKPVVVAVAIALVACHFILSSNKRNAAMDLFIIGFVGIIGWLALFGYFAATGRFQIFYDTIITYNRYYSGDLIGNLLAPIYGGAEVLTGILNPIAIFAFIGFILTLIKDRKRAILLAAFVFSGWLAIALPGRFSVHYFQLWLPPLIIGSAWAIGSFASSAIAKTKILSPVAGILILGLLTVSEYPEYVSAIEKHWNPVVQALNSSESTALKINDILAQNETFFLWGNTPNLYLLANKRPPTPVLFDSHLAENPLFDHLSSQVRSELTRDRPELLVAEKDRPAVPDWIMQDYIASPVIFENPGYTFFARRGGRLAMQLGSN